MVNDDIKIEITKFKRVDLLLWIIYFDEGCFYDIWSSTIFLQHDICDILHSIGVL